MEAGVQTGFFPFSNIEVEMSTAVRSSLSSPGNFAVHLGAVRK